MTLKMPTMAASTSWLYVKPRLAFSTPETTGPNVSPRPMLALKMPAATSFSSFEKRY